MVRGATFLIFDRSLERFCGICRRKHANKRMGMPVHKTLKSQTNKTLKAQNLKMPNIPRRLTRWSVGTATRPMRSAGKARANLRATT